MMRVWRQILLGRRFPGGATGRVAERVMKNDRSVTPLLLDERGTAAIEFAAVASFLSFLLLGLTDFGVGYWEKIEVGNAARAGAEYAVPTDGTNPRSQPR
jgi:Flp pilus assembly protein TadG